MSNGENYHSPESFVWENLEDYNSQASSFRSLNSSYEERLEIHEGGVQEQQAGDTLPKHLKGTTTADQKYNSPILCDSLITKLRTNDSRERYQDRKAEKEGFFNHPSTEQPYIEIQFGFSQSDRLKSLMKIEQLTISECKSVPNIEASPPQISLTMSMENKEDYLSKVSQNESLKELPVYATQFHTKRDEDEGNIKEQPFEKNLKREYEERSDQLLNEVNDILNPNIVQQSHSSRQIEPTDSNSTSFFTARQENSFTENDETFFSMQSNINTSQDKENEQNKNLRCINGCNIKYFKPFAITPGGYMQGQLIFQEKTSVKLEEKTTTRLQQVPLQNEDIDLISVHPKFILSNTSSTEFHQQNDDSARQIEQSIIVTELASNGILEVQSREQRLSDEKKFPSTIWMGQGHSSDQADIEEDVQLNEGYGLQSVEKNKKQSKRQDQGLLNQDEAELNLGTQKQYRSEGISVILMSQIQNCNNDMEIIEQQKFEEKWQSESLPQIVDEDQIIIGSCQLQGQRGSETLSYLKEGNPWDDLPSHISLHESSLAEDFVKEVNQSKFSEDYTTNKQGNASSLDSQDSFIVTLIKNNNQAAIIQETKMAVDVSRKIAKLQVMIKNLNEEDEMEKLQSSKVRWIGDSIESGINGILEKQHVLLDQLIREKLYTSQDQTIVQTGKVSQQQVKNQKQSQDLTSYQSQQANLKEESKNIRLPTRIEVKQSKNYLKPISANSDKGVTENNNYLQQKLVSSIDFQYLNYNSVKHPQVAERKEAEIGFNKNNLNEMLPSQLLGFSNRVSQGYLREQLYQHDAAAITMQNAEIYYHEGRQIRDCVLQDDKQLRDAKEYLRYSLNSHTPIITEISQEAQHCYCNNLSHPYSTSFECRCQFQQQSDTSRVRNNFSLQLQNYQTEKPQPFNYSINRFADNFLCRYSAQQI